MSDDEKNKVKHPVFKKPDALSDTAKRQDVEQPEGEVEGSDKAEPTRFGDWEVDGRCTDF